MQRKKSEPKSVGEILSKFDPTKDKYISREFQAYGYYLAKELDDLTHVSMYIKLSKNQHRSVLDKALSFVKDSKARSKGRLFMWKMKELGAFQNSNDQNSNVNI